MRIGNFLFNIVIFKKYTIYRCSYHLNLIINNIKDKNYYLDLFTIK